LRERNLATNVAARWHVLVPDLGQLLGHEAVGESNQRRPEPAMNQRDLAVEEPTHEDLLGFGDGFQDGVDVVAPRVRPPTAFDGFADDGLGETRRGSLRRSQHDTMLPDKGQGFLSICADVHDARRFACAADQLPDWAAPRRFT